METPTGKPPWATPHLTILNSASTARGGLTPSDGEGDGYHVSPT